MRQIKKIVIHCSDSDHPHHDNIETIREWHIKERGWADIGYHFLITKDGAIRTGRPLTKPGAHCKGQNADSVGICLTGKNEFSKKQFQSLRILTGGLKNFFNKYYLEIKFHNELDSSKTCPNFTCEDWVDALEEWI